MWKFRFLGRFKPIRLFVQWLSTLYFFEGKLHVIKRGPLRDLMWKCSSGQQFWMPLGVYEHETANWLLSRLGPGLVFFDIGANFGYFTLMASRAVGPSGQVYSFEPIPANAALIQSMSKLNKLSNISVHRVAVCDSVGSVDFTVESKNANSHMTTLPVSHALSNPLKVIAVDSVTLDFFSQSNSSFPDVIKVDVEGAEMAVLIGSHSILSSWRSHWIISTHSSELESSCRDFMMAYGYDVRSLPGFHHELLCTPPAVRSTSA